MPGDIVFIVGGSTPGSLLVLPGNSLHAKYHNDGRTQVRSLHRDRDSKSGWSRANSPKAGALSHGPPALEYAF
jgi:hypothetical protein